MVCQPTATGTHVNSPWSPIGRTWSRDFRRFCGHPNHNRVDDKFANTTISHGNYWDCCSVNSATDTVLRLNVPTFAASTTNRTWRALVRRKREIVSVNKRNSKIKTAVKTMWDLTHQLIERMNLMDPYRSVINRYRMPLSHVRSADWMPCIERLNVQCLKHVHHKFETLAASRYVFAFVLSEIPNRLSVSPLTFRLLTFCGNLVELISHTSNNLDANSARRSTCKKFKNKMMSLAQHGLSPNWWINRQWLCSATVLDKSTKCSYFSKILHQQFKKVAQQFVCIFIQFSHCVMQF